MKAIELNDTNFASTLSNTDGVVLVDFHADWCGPCQQLSPIIEQVAEEQGDNATVAKVNIEEARETAGRFGIRSIPTLIAFRNGEPAGSLHGVQPKQRITQLIEEANLN